MLTPKVVLGKIRLIGLPVKKHVELVVIHCPFVELSYKRNIMIITILMCFKMCLNIGRENK